MGPAMLDTPHIGKQVGQYGRSAARFFAHLQQHRRTTHARPRSGEPSLVCHLESAADVAFPARGLGGAMMRGRFKAGRNGRGFAVSKGSFAYFPTGRNVSPLEGTIGFWLRLPRPLSVYRYRRIVSSGAYNQPEEFYIWVDAEGVRAVNRVGKASTAVGVRPSRSSADGWHYVALMWDTSQLALSVDGRARSAPNTCAQLGMGTTLLVGDPSGGADVVMDEITVWPRNIDVASAALKDIPPPTPRSMSVQPIASGQARVSWSIAGSYGTACSVRYYTEPITSENWAEAEPIRAAPRPGPDAAHRPGSDASRWAVVAKDLPDVSRIWFAVRTRSRYYLDSAMSNVVSIRMQGPRRAN